MRLFDTDVLIEHLRGNPRGTDLVVAAIEADEAAISVLTRFELMAGMRSHERSLIVALLDAMVNLPVTEAIAGRASTWARKYRTSHDIGTIDYLIAASAETTGAQLLTRNIKHYPMFPDLTPAL